MKRPWNSRAADAIENAFFKRLKEAQRKMAPPRGFQSRLRSLLQRLQTGLPAVVVDRIQDAPKPMRTGANERDVLAAQKPARKRRRGKGRPGKRP